MQDGDTQTQQQAGRADVLHPWGGEQKASRRLIFIGNLYQCWGFFLTSLKQIYTSGTCQHPNVSYEEKQKDMAAASTELTQSQ